MFKSNVTIAQPSLVEQAQHLEDMWAAFTRNRNGQTYLAAKDAKNALLSSLGIE